MALYEKRVVLNKDELNKIVTEKVAAELGYGRAHERRVRIRSYLTAPTTDEWKEGTNPIVEEFEKFSAIVADEVREILVSDPTLSRFLRIETNGTIIDPTTFAPVFSFSAVFI